ncbi:MAG: hypothetical protein AAB512_00575 [Patescibacteria group bacterium]
MDITQAVLLSTIIVLAIFLVAVGLQAFFTLKDLRKTLKKVNKIMEDADDIVTQIKKPIETAGNVFTAVTAGAGIAHIIKKITGEIKHERSEK